MSGAAFQRYGNVIADCNVTRSKIEASCVDIETDGHDRQMSRLVRMQDHLRVN
jgi:hypothetical protein